MELFEIIRLLAFIFVVGIFTINAYYIMRNRLQISDEAVDFFNSIASKKSGIEVKPVKNKTKMSVIVNIFTWYMESVTNSVVNAYAGDEKSAKLVLSEIDTLTQLDRYLPSFNRNYERVLEISDAVNTLCLKCIDGELESNELLCTQLDIAVALGRLQASVVEII